MSGNYVIHLFQFPKPDGNKGRVSLFKNDDNSLELLLQAEEPVEPEKCPECGQTVGLSKKFVDVGRVPVNDSWSIPKPLRRY